MVKAGFQILDNFSDHGTSRDRTKESKGQHCVLIVEIV